MSLFKIDFFKSKNDAPKDDNELVSTLEELFQIADKHRRKFEPDVWGNVAYLAGDQWVSFESDIQRYRKIDIVAPAAGKFKAVDNQILPLARQAAATLRAHIAQQDAIPDNNSPEAVKAAQLATDFLSDRYETDKELVLRFNEIMHLIVAGECLRMTTWDVTRGRDGLSGFGGEGDIKTETVPFFRFYKCPFNEGPDYPSEWIIQADVRDVDWINDTFNTDVTKEDTANATRTVDKLLYTLVEGQNYSPESKSNAAILKRLYLNPSPRYPKGKLYVWANKKLIIDTELPDGFMPFVGLQWLPIPHRLYALPLISNLRPLQKQFNISMSQMFELVIRQLRGDMVVTGEEPRQEVDAVTGQKKIIVNNGSRVDFMRYELNTNDARDIRAQLTQDMQQISGVHDPSMGQTASGSQTATEIAMLKDSDKEGLVLIREGLDLAYCDVSSQKIELARNNYKNYRTVRVISPSNEVNSTGFFGYDLGNTKLVRPKTTPILSQAQIQTIKQEAIAKGLLGPYANAEDELAKKQSYISLGIPGAREEIEKVGLPMDELTQIVSKIRINKAQIELVTSELMLMESQSKIQMAMNPAPMLPEAGMMPMPEQEIPEEQMQTGGMM